jgi:hypothetical protein
MANNIRYLNWDDDIVGQHEQVLTHLHSPETERRRSMGDDAMVFSVLDNRSKVIGQVEQGAVSRPFAKVDLYHLQEHLNNLVNPKTGKRGKTRNTLIGGEPIPSNIEGDAHPLMVRPGNVSIPEGPMGRTILSAQTERGIVPRHRNPKLGQQFEGIVVPKQQPSTSSTFGRAARFGRFGIHVIDPFEGER